MVPSAPTTYNNTFMLFRFLLKWLVEYFVCDMPKHALFDCCSAFRLLRFVVKGFVCVIVVDNGSVVACAWWLCARLGG